MITPKKNTFLLQDRPSSLVCEVFEIGVSAFSLARSAVPDAEGSVASLEEVRSRLSPSIAGSAEP